jgi:uncharacterized protein YkwD
MLATLILASTLIVQAPALSPLESQILAEANAARAARGVPPFVWDRRLAACAREAAANNWDSHEYFFQGRAARYGAANEGSFPGVYGLDGIFSMMVSHPRMSRGLHARQFFDPSHRRIGAAYGGNGPTSDGPFYVFVYGR